MREFGPIFMRGSAIGRIVVVRSLSWVWGNTSISVDKNFNSKTPTHFIIFDDCRIQDSVVNIVIGLIVFDSFSVLVSLGLGWLYVRLYK